MKRVGLIVVLLLLALAPGVRAQTAAPLPPSAEEAIRKGTLAAGQKQWAVALRYFGQALESAPDAPQPLFNLGLAEAQLPGRELRAIAWFRAYLVLAPDAANAAAVRDQIDALDIAAEGRANEILALLKQLAAQLPAGSSEAREARSVLDLLATTLAAPTPVPAALPADVPFSAAQRTEAWTAFVRRDLSGPLFVDFQPALAGTGAVSADTDNKAWAVFSAARSLADTWLARLADVRRARPETNFVAGILVERERQAAAARLAPFQTVLVAVRAFVTKFTVGSGLTMVLIAPGEFTMGDETIGYSDTRPQHLVSITRPFFLGACEVTQAQWTAVMGSNPSDINGYTLPVEQVSWDDAMAFCKKLNDQERAARRLPAGWEFTLPTEAQWEYACRAGTTGVYAGDLDAMAWYEDNSKTVTAQNIGTTHPVGQKKPNAWGLYDMHGNVSEWCLDWYWYNYSGANVTDPGGPPSGSERISRGGSFLSPARHCPSALRSKDKPDFSSMYVGFRLALVTTR